MPPETRRNRSLGNVTVTVDALRNLRDRLAATGLSLDVDEAADARREKTELLDQIDDYLLPRLERLDAPLLVVIGGSTGAGKSTIANTLVGAEVSTAGVLRPTTRVPVLVCHPDDESWFAGGGVLPDLPRTTGDRPASGSGLHLVVNEAMPSGLGILDAPDIDSVETANHELAGQLLGAADLWLFVTTAARYADAVPWDHLARARERSIGLAVVVNRIPAGAETEVQTHLAEMLQVNGLEAAELFALTEEDLPDGRITDDSIAQVSAWLNSLVADSDSRSRHIRTTLDGVLRSIPPRIERIDDALRIQAAGAESLRALSRHHYDAALGHIDAELDNGALLRGEVLDRWREHVGTGEFMDRLQRGVGRIRDRIGSIFTGRSAPDEAAQGQLESNLEILVRHAADQAALDTVEGWESLPGGRGLLGTAPRGLDRSSERLGDTAKTEIAGWELFVLDLVHEQAGNKLAIARTLSLGINGLGVALMIAVFSHTGGLTGGEAGVAAGTAAMSQTVLTAVFGEQAVRDLARRSREDLQLRMAGVFELERARFEALLAGVDSVDDADALSAAAVRVDEARP